MRNRNQSNPRRKSTRLSIETLETRRLMAADVMIEGTDGDDVAEFWIHSLQYRLNDGPIEQIESQTVAISFDGLGGSDQVIVHGSEFQDDVVISQNGVAVYAGPLSFSAEGIADIEVYGGGGENRVLLYDTPGDDQLTISPGTAQIETSLGTTAKVVDFSIIHASSSTGFDTAEMIDSPSSVDYLISKEGKVTLRGDAFENRVNGFDEVTVTSSMEGPDDRAYLYDSPGNDYLTVTPDTSRMVTETSNVAAHGFERTYGYASGGFDTAELHDTAGDDSFEAKNNYARLFGGSIYVKAHDFERNVGIADGGGYDKAYLYDSAGDDLLVISDERVRLLGESVDREGVGFERNYSYGRNGGANYVRVYDEVFDDDDDITSLMGSDRRAKRDSIQADPDLIRLFSGDYYRRAEGFLVTDILGYNPDELVGRVSESGAVGVNADFDDGIRTDYFIEMQRYGAELVVAGLSVSDPGAVDQGIAILQWGLDQQAADGSFPLSGDPVHSTSLFAEAVGRSIMELERFNYRPFDGYHDEWIGQLSAMTHWLISVDQDSADVDLKDFGHRYFLRAAAIKRAALLASDSVLDAEANAYMQAGLARQDDNGVFAERGGFDISYQSLGLKYAGDFYRLTDNLAIRDEIRNAFTKSLPLFQARIDSAGNVDVSDSTRITESTRGGGAKTFDRQNAVRAYLSGFAVTGDQAYLDLAQALVNAR